MEFTFRKKLLFYGILLCFVWIFIEVISFAAYRFRYGTLSFLQGERQEIINKYSNTLKSDNPHAGKKNWNVIHPYLGFVTEGIDNNRKCSETGPCDKRLRTYDDLPFLQSTDKNLIVGVIGGSFAAGVSSNGGGKSIERQFKKIPRFKDKEIVVYHLAPGGYKQPQQLLKINYYLSMGAEFDIVINIDGFNEIALPGVENLTKGVHPVFPRSWYYYVDSSLNPRLLTLYGKKENYKQQQYSWASFFSRPIVNTLPSTNLIWKFQNIRLMRKIKAADVALVEYQESSDRKLRYATTGPDYNFSSWDSFYENMAKIWSRSSYQLFQLCKGLGIEYYHFLQPNQYVKDSKILLEKEKKIAISAKSKYGKAASEGYPHLINQGKWLQEYGVPYYDLTMMFKDNSKQFYIDNCCHLNSPGYNLVIQEIAQSITDLPSTAQ